MTCIPCKQDALTKKKIEEIAEVLKEQAHLIEGLNLSEDELYDTGLFRGAIERIRGQFSASMYEKRAFAKLVLNYMEDAGEIAGWQSAGGQNRFDYEVRMPSGRVVVVELKGCLDGNNTTIFERPAQAQEFYVWSVCQNAGANPSHNAWSGIHVRLSAEIIDKEKQVDGLIIWDMVCGSIGRPCPKLVADPTRATDVGQYQLPPPCLYLFPATIPAPRNNPNPAPHKLEDLEFMSALQRCFQTRPEEIFTVRFEAEYRASGLARRTEIGRDGAIVKTSKWAQIRRK